MANIPNKQDVYRTEFVERVFHLFHDIMVKAMSWLKEIQCLQYNVEYVQIESDHQVPREWRGGRNECIHKSILQRKEAISENEALKKDLRNTYLIF